MSRVPRQPNTPIATPAVASTDAEILDALAAEVVAPVVAAPVAAESVEAVPAEPADAKKPRIQTNKAIGTSIPVARTRGHLDRQGINKAANDMIAELSKVVDVYDHSEQVINTGIIKYTLDDSTKLYERSPTPDELNNCKTFVATNAALAAENRKLIDALSSQKTRFSSSAAVALTVVIDEVLEEWLKLTAKATIENKRAVMTVTHAYSAGVTGLRYHKLLSGIPLFASNLAKFSAERDNVERETFKVSALAAARKELQVKHTQTVKALKAELVARGWAEPAKPVEPVAVAAAAPAAPVAAAPVAAAPVAVAAATPVAAAPKKKRVSHPMDKTKYSTYIGNMAKKVISTNTHLATLKISAELRCHMSDIAIAFINVYGPAIKHLTNCKAVKTVDEKIVMQVIQQFMVFGVPHTETFTYENAIVPNPETVKENNKKRDAAKKSNTDFKVDPKSVDKVQVTVAVSNIEYHSESYNALAKVVEEKLKIYDGLGKKTVKA